MPKSLVWSAPQLVLQDDLTLSALVPQNALPSDLLENALCGVAFGLGVLGIVLGIVFFICSQKPCSGGKSLGKVREPGTRLPVWVCARILLMVWGPVCSQLGLYAGIWGPCYRHSYWGAQK